MCVSSFDKKYVFRRHYPDPRTAIRIFVLCLHGGNLFVLLERGRYGLGGENTRVFYASEKGYHGGPVGAEKGSSSEDALDLWETLPFSGACFLLEHVILGIPVGEPTKGCWCGIYWGFKHLEMHVRVGLLKSFWVSS